MNGTSKCKGRRLLATTKQLLYLHPLTTPMGQPPPKPTAEKTNTWQLYNLPSVTQPGGRRTGICAQTHLFWETRSTSFPQDGDEKSLWLPGPMQYYIWGLGGSPEAVPQACFYSASPLLSLLCFPEWSSLADKLRRLQHSTLNFLSVSWSIVLKRTPEVGMCEEKLLFLR